MECVGEDQSSFNFTILDALDNPHHKFSNNNNIIPNFKCSKEDKKEYKKEEGE